MPSVFYRFTQQQTIVVFRFSSQDPMTIPVYLGQPVIANDKSTENAYFYGALYGSLVILLVYNFWFFLSPLCEINFFSKVVLLKKLPINAFS